MLVSTGGEITTGGANINKTGAQAGGVHIPNRRLNLPRLTIAKTPFGTKNRMSKANISECAACVVTMDRRNVPRGT